ncbi:YdcF family protein [Rhodococcus sp. USK13]|uniref:YdcF family protein n=1 Tax=Rhodococcus sp. USK13 TaxID=2806442 RepID=UPI001BCFD1A9|nr:YdcF family protein [Rhodococcus sp. USK13]
MVRIRWILLFFVGALCGLVIAAVGLGLAGYFIYTKSRIDPLKPVDAIIVLAGEHDGREEYGIDLARRGVSRHVVLSNPHFEGDRTMSAYCDLKDSRLTVRCIPPQPPTTRGEAIFTRELAAENGWDSVLVVSWRYHLPRARYIFSQCFDGDVSMRAVPRSYDFSLAEWEYTYLYQTVGFVKAFLQGPCG